MFTDFINMILTNYGLYAFAIIFVIIFVETGLVFFPFLPGDSLLFMTGASIAKSGYNPIIFIIILAIAAILGDYVNYTLGKNYGLALRRVPFFGKFIKDDHIAETEHFFCQIWEHCYFPWTFCPNCSDLYSFYFRYWSHGQEEIFAL